MDGAVYHKHELQLLPGDELFLYTDGVTILKNLIAGTKVLEERKAYADEMMKVYDQQLQYLDKLNSLRKTPWTDYFVKGEKAHNYITYYPRMDSNVAYDMLAEVVAQAFGKHGNGAVNQIYRCSTLYSLVVHYGTWCNIVGYIGDMDSHLPYTILNLAD